MRRILSILSILVISATASAQIPNPSFENWTDGLPDGWYTTNIPGFAVPVTPVQTAAAGDLALQGEVVSFAGFGSYPPYIQSIFPVSEQPAALTGSYIFSPVGGDSLYIDIVFFNLSQGFGYGAGALVAPPTGSSFEHFTVPIVYFNSGKGAAADSCFIQLAIFGQDTVHVGSKMIIDDLAFSATSTAVEDEPGVPAAFALEQNYPNPFNPETTIRYALPAAAHSTLTVSNLLGETVATLVDAYQPAGNNEARFDAANLPSGVYLYTLRSGAFTETRRMLLLK